MPENTKPQESHYFDVLIPVHLYGCTLDEKRKEYLRGIAARVIEACRRGVGTYSVEVVVLLCGGATDPAQPGITEADVARDFLINECGIGGSCRIICLYTTSGIEHVRAVVSWIKEAKLGLQRPDSFFFKMEVYIDKARWAIPVVYRWLMRWIALRPDFLPFDFGMRKGFDRLAIEAGNVKTCLSLFLPIDRLSQAFIQWARRRDWRLVR